MNKIQKSNTKSEKLIVFFENILEIFTEKEKTRTYEKVSWKLRKNNKEYIFRRLNEDWIKRKKYKKMWYVTCII